jgi:hypothetical protein
LKLLNSEQNPEQGSLFSFTERKKENKSKIATGDASSNADDPRTCIFSIFTPA